MRTLDDVFGGWDWRALTSGGPVADMPGQKRTGDTGILKQRARVEKGRNMRHTTTLTEPRIPALAAWPSETGPLYLECLRFYILTGDLAQYQECLSAKKTKLGSVEQ